MAEGRMIVSFDEPTISALSKFSDKIEKAIWTLAAIETFKKEPTEPGFYVYTGGNQNMVFLLTVDGWQTIFDNGEGPLECDWGYIEQALGVYDLVRIDALTGGF